MMLVDVGVVGQLELGQGTETRTFTIHCGEMHRVGVGGHPVADTRVVAV